ncbi:uncharacterized protein ATNIH1004_003952 [Aspergillus tanneri]|uniref:Zn(2)-C6 fungal-type domain-containing protein n=1 Tax=Aspergillus tanneri TaxID=1220188 RepID=A0A5M9MTY6_9EURO|nr:uncharacterized protein ATNIH1004_003952 [Aspergillus tanneri]KAA8648069.1 hypothetical protein ATNIH1004_003952 [Aspergillus tanneri]
MSAQKTPAKIPPGAPSARPSTRYARAMACILCQQRKVRCDREFPCVNCMRAGVQCVPAVARPRRRRFPERELLERVRRYESLLREHHILFEPLHPSGVETPSQSDNGKDSDTITETTPGLSAMGPHSSPSEISSVKCETSYEAKNFWDLMNQMTLDRVDEDKNNNLAIEGDEVNFSHNNARETVIKKTWDQVYQGNDQNFLFGSSKTNKELSALHPEQLHIFKLWQIYLNNVNPILKVTHTPTLQPSIIDAAGDIANISPALEALMFGIYAVSILSLDKEGCYTIFKASKEELLKAYQFGCQQALLNCKVLQTGNRDCLTALYLYLISVRPVMDPRSLYSMLGSAIRIAQRMGLDNKAAYAQYTALEGEMRRRLWWSLVIFDNRICEMSHHKTTSLIPTWDCPTPLNLNDFDIQPEMKSPPPSHNKPTEALFAVIRSEVAEFIRHSAFHLDFTSPSLKKIANLHHGTSTKIEKLEAFENMLEDKYLKFCNLENPLHFMTIWTARGQLAKNRLMDHYSKFASMEQTDDQRNSANAYALRILECDTKIMDSPLTKGYLWLAHFYLPFPAYIHILKDLKNRPMASLTEMAWEIISNNYKARFADTQANPFFEFLCTIVLQAWEAYEAACEATSRPLHTPLPTPRIVTDIKQKMAQSMSRALSDTSQPKYSLDVTIDDFLMSMPMDFVGTGLGYEIEGQGLPGEVPAGYPDMPGVHAKMNQSDWTTIDWCPGHGPNS